MGLALAPAVFEAATAEAAKDRIFADIHDTAQRLESLCVVLRELAFGGNGIGLRIFRPEQVTEANLLNGLIKDLIPPPEGEGER